MQAFIYAMLQQILRASSSSCERSASRGFVTRADTGSRADSCLVNLSILCSMFKFAMGFLLGAERFQELSECRRFVLPGPRPWLSCSAPMSLSSLLECRDMLAGNSSPLLCQQRSVKRTHIVSLSTNRF